jgi:hypothetical protein
MRIVMNCSIDAIFIHDSSNRKTKRIEIAESTNFRVRSGDICELQIAEGYTNPGTNIVNFAFSLGSIQIETSGFIKKDNRVWLGNVLVGHVVGFANLSSLHYAIVISSDKRDSAFDLHSIATKRISFDSTSFIMM